MKSQKTHNFIQRTILKAGKISLDYRKQLSTINIQRKSAKDLVTEADMTVEDFIITEIRQTYPDHAVFAEEKGFYSGNEYLWVIDPIDGTTSYIHGHPSYCISIALQKSDQTVLAAVYAPALDELYMAELHNGATLNGIPIHVSDCSQLSDCLFNSGFCCLRSDWENNNIPNISRIAPLARGIRMSGAAALDLAFVACGCSDGYWELNLNIYDVAAGRLLVTEAGGQVTDLSGGYNSLPFEIFASNGQVHQKMVDLFSESTINSGI